MVHEDHVNGEMLLAGIDPDTLDARRWLQVVYALRVRWEASAFTPPAAVMKELDRVIELHTAIAEPETWGTGPDAAAQQANMEALIGLQTQGPPGT